MYCKNCGERLEELEVSSLDNKKNKTMKYVLIIFGIVISLILVVFGLVMSIFNFVDNKLDEASEHAVIVFGNDTIPTLYPIVGKREVISYESSISEDKSNVTITYSELNSQCSSNSVDSGYGIMINFNLVSDTEYQIQYTKDKSVFNITFK